MAKLTKLLNRAQGSGFVGNFFLTSGTNILLLVIALISGPLLARLLGPEGRGAYQAIFNIPAFIIQTLNLGLPLALVYYIGQNKEEGPSLVITMWLMSIPICLGWMGLAYFFMPTLLKAQTAETIYYARLYLLVIPIGYIELINFALQAWDEFATFNFVRLLRSVVYIAVLGLIWLIPDWRQAGILAVLVLMTRPIMTAVLLPTIRRYGVKLSTPPNWGRAIPMLRYGLASFLGKIPETLNGRLDQLVMASRIPAVALGYYSVAVSWSLFLSPLINGLATVVFPYISTTKNKESARIRFTQSTRFSFTLVVVLIGPLLFVTPYAIRLLFSDEYIPAILSSQILTVASIFLYMNGLLASGLRGIGLPILTAWAQFAGLAATLIGLYFLLPVYGIEGASVASLIAYFITFLILTYYCMHHFSVGLKEIFLLNKEDLMYIKQFILKQRR